MDKIEMPAVSRRTLIKAGAGAAAAMTVPTAFAAAEKAAPAAAADTLSLIHI